MISCKQCNASIPVIRLFFNTVKCGNCGAVHKVDEQFSIMMGTFGLMLAALGTLGDGYMFFIIAIVICVVVIFMLNIFRVFDKYLSLEE